MSALPTKVEMLADGQILVEDIDNSLFCHWVSAFAAIKVTERPVEGLHSRINTILRVQPNSSLAFISNTLRFERLLAIIAGEPCTVEDAQGRLYLLEKSVGFRREVCSILNLEMTQEIASLSDRELSNLLYRDNLRTKHSEPGLE